MDRQNYDSQDRPRICSRGKNASIRDVVFSMTGSDRNKTKTDWKLSVYYFPIRLRPVGQRLVLVTLYDRFSHFEAV